MALPLNYKLAPSYWTDTCDSAAVVYVTRNDGNKVALTFYRESALPMNDIHEISTLALGTMQMGEAQARALYEAIGKVLSPTPAAK